LCFRHFSSKFKAKPEQNAVIPVCLRRRAEHGKQCPGWSVWLSRDVQLLQFLCVLATAPLGKTDSAAGVEIRHGCGIIPHRLCKDFLLVQTG